MANLSKTRTVFAFTSPRTIEKIIPEIDLLIRYYQGKVWVGNSDLQADFFDRLTQTDFFEGTKQVAYPDFAARDRITRAPQMLGFVNLSPKIELTEVGQQLLSGIRTNEVIARQLLKFQLPSPYHKIPGERNFNVRPYLEFLRLVISLGSVSKTEIAIFFVQITNYRKFDRIVEAIKKFRRDAKNYHGNRKEFVRGVFDREIKKIYASEIKDGDLKTRESADSSLTNFIRTKRQNHGDYADAFIRYLRATQFISFEKRTFRIIISPSRAHEVDYILENTPRGEYVFENIEQFKEYFFSSTSLELLTDNKDYLLDRLTDLRIKVSRKTDVEELKNILEEAESNIINERIEETKSELQDYKDFDDVIEVFDKVVDKSIPDPPLYLEWNIWRSFIMMNYAKEVKGNFRIDLDGLPLNTALGNMPDIEIDYEDFKLIVEVTMSTGNKQYEMEGEPVGRHFGNVQKNSNVPVYCLFVAPKINDSSLVHFYSQNQINTKAYGGKTKIIPMSLESFILFLSIARTNKFNDKKKLKYYLDSIIEYNSEAADEVDWADKIKAGIPTWAET